MLHQAWHVPSGKLIAEFDDDVLADDFVARQATPGDWLLIPYDPDDDEDEDIEEEETDV